MKWLRDILSHRQREPEAAFDFIRTRFADYLSLVEKSNRGLRLIKELAASSPSGVEPDMPSFRATLDALRKEVQGAVEDLIAITGDKRAALMDRYEAIDGQITETLEAARNNWLGDTLERVVPLRALDVPTEDLSPANCQTLHDVLRFAHQEGVRELFTAAHDVLAGGNRDCLKSGQIPFPVNIVYADRDRLASAETPCIDETQIRCTPMRAFWNGLIEQGWPPDRPHESIKGPISAVGKPVSAPRAKDFAENSFALLSDDHMIISLYMGYHVAMLDATCSPRRPSSYVRLQLSQGGAPLDRRIRRVRLITRVLDRAGFDSVARDDVLDAIVVHRSAEVIADKLHMLGRLMIMIKQLDMALSSEDLVDWYADDLIRRLGLDEAPRGTD